MIQSMHFILIILVISLSYVTSAFHSASFVKAAEPTIVTASEPSSTPSRIYSARNLAIVSGYRKSETSLHAKKSKRGAAVKKGGKVQVKMLKFVEGTGRVGDIVTVSPAYWENKLKKTKSAVMITDDEVAEEKKEANAAAKQNLDTAKKIKEKITNIGSIDMFKKAGPDGHLFGGINKKALLSEVQKKLPKGSLEGKIFKVLSVKDDSDSLVSHDIKNVGVYKIKLNLHTDVQVDVTINVQAE